MNDERIEEGLRQALRRTEPPAGFAERVMERIARDGRAVVVPFWRRRMIQQAAAAVLLVILGGGLFAGYRHEQRRRGEEAAAQVMAALGIASEKMNIAKHRIEHQSAQ